MGVCVPPSGSSADVFTAECPKPKPAYRRPAEPVTLGPFSSREIAQPPPDLEVNTTPPAVAHKGPSQEAGVQQSTFNGKQMRSLPVPADRRRPLTCPVCPTYVGLWRSTYVSRALVRATLEV